MPPDPTTSQEGRASEQAPLEFVGRSLLQEGALVDHPSEGTLFSVLPPDMQELLDLPEATLLHDRAGADGGTGDPKAEGVACGYGTELLRTVAERVVTRGATAVAMLPTELPGRKLPTGEYQGLNVSLRLSPLERAREWLVSGFFHVEATTDDRRGQDVTAAVLLGDGTPVPRFALEEADLGPTELTPPADALAAVEHLLLADAMRGATDALAGFRSMVARRNRRDVLRVDAYFRQLNADLTRRMARARTSDGLERKRAALVAERDRRLQTLRENGTIRARLSPVALVAILSPVCRASLTIHRRKSRRTVTVTWHPLVRHWLALRCDGCGHPTHGIGACDERVHVLCARCLEADDCPRCQDAWPLPSPRIHLEARRERITPGINPLEAGRLAEARPTWVRQQTTGGEADATSPLEARSLPAADAKPAPPRRRPPSQTVDRRPPRTPAAKRTRPDADDLTARVLRILSRVSRGWTSRELQEETDASAAALRSVLQRLIEDERVVSWGQTRGKQYQWKGSGAPTSPSVTTTSRDSSGAHATSSSHLVKAPSITSFLTSVLDEARRSLPPIERDRLQRTIDEVGVFLETQVLTTLNARDRRRLKELRRFRPETSDVDLLSVLMLPPALHGLVVKQALDGTDHLRDLERRASVVLHLFEAMHTQRLVEPDILREWRTRTDHAVAVIATSARLRERLVQRNARHVWSDCTHPEASKKRIEGWFRIERIRRGSIWLLHLDTDRRFGPIALPRPAIELCREGFDVAATLILVDDGWDFMRVERVSPGSTLT